MNNILNTVKPGERNYTIIKTTGEVLKQGVDGVILVSELGTVLCTVSEISDNDCTNVFFSKVVGNIVSDDDGNAEILI